MLSPEVCKSCVGNAGYYSDTGIKSRDRWICKHDDCLEIRFLTRDSKIPKVCRKRFEQCVAQSVNIDTTGGDDHA